MREQNILAQVLLFTSSFPKSIFFSTASIEQRFCGLLSSAICCHHNVLPIVDRWTALLLKTEKGCWDGDMLSSLGNGIGLLACEAAATRDCSLHVMFREKCRWWSYPGQIVIALLFVVVHFPCYLYMCKVLLLSGFHTADILRGDTGALDICMGSIPGPPVDTEIHGYNYIWYCCSNQCLSP